MRVVTLLPSSSSDNRTISSVSLREFNTECAKGEERALSFSGRLATARRISSHFPIVGARVV